ncbi:MAG: 50S ribosomal protein L18 [Ignavibacteriae bacterium]|nr:50S ribosomal protein L18 [Ignavibacteriota bacterium]
MILKNITERRLKKKFRIRKKVQGTGECPRLTVYRSLNHIYAQLIDDTVGKTLVQVSSLTKEVREQAKAAKKPSEVAKLIGKVAGQKAIEKNIQKAVFDRNGYLYHGRVKAVAEGAREAGLKF